MLPELVLPLKGDPLPDEDHVIRQCSGTAVERDPETQQPIGITKDAFDDDPMGCPSHGLSISQNHLIQHVQRWRL